MKNAVRVFTLAIPCAVCPALLSCTESAEEKAERELNTARAIVATKCESAVKDRLRSPGSADFPFDGVFNVTATGPSTYRQVSYVDSQNGFGALIRTNFVCEATGAGEELSGYRVTNMTFR
jgi:hypothetical protein